MMVIMNPTVIKVTVRRNLSPLAEEFVPAVKRESSTTSEELRARQMWQEMDMSMDTIKEGDDGLTGLNVLEMGDLQRTLTADQTDSLMETARPLQSLPRPPPPKPHSETGAKVLSFSLLIFKLLTVFLALWPTFSTFPGFKH